MLLSTDIQFQIIKILPFPNEKSGDTGDYDNDTTDKNYHRYKLEMGSAG